MTSEQDYLVKFEECNEKFDTVFDLTSIASKIINSDLIILRVNPAMVTLLGYPEEELVGTKIMDYACPEYKKNWGVLQEALWNKKMPNFKLEVCLIKKDQTLVWVNVTAVLFRENGQTYGHTVLDDFTYRKEFEESERKLKDALAQSTRVQEDLRFNKQRLEQILDTMAEGVGIFDQNGQATYTNPTARKILGLSGDDNMQGHFLERPGQNLRIDGTVLPEDEHPLNTVLSTGTTVYDVEIAIQPERRDRFNISINAAPILNEEQQITGAICTFMDVTNRRKITTLKDEFISIASHELRTPVTSLKAALQLLDRIKEKSADPMMPKLITQANRSLDKVSVLIEDLLNASKLSAGQLHINKRQFNMAELINDSCLEIRLKGEYELRTLGNMEVDVIADASRIDQVITNFVNNAIKYAPQSKEILLRVERTGNFVKVSVEDKGPGIDAEKLPHLFDRYYRVDNSGNQYSGLGLGLYINAEIVRRHNGEIGVDSQPGEGSKFWFTLPLGTIDAKEAFKPIS